MESNEVSALINLLEDEDNQISTVAMQRLLENEQETDKLIKKYQESSNPRLRNRIYQLGNVLRLRRKRSEFVQSAQNSSMSLWEGVVHINYLHNTDLSLESINDQLSQLSARLPKRLSTVRLSSFMKQEDFSYSASDPMGADLFLVDDVLKQRVGSPIILSVLARYLGRQSNWNSSIVLYRGKHCLIDANCNLIEPAENWKVTRLSKDDKLHPCTDKDIWLTVLSQLFLASMLEGSLQSIHRVGSILCELCDADFQSLPYPLGS